MAKRQTETVKDAPLVLPLIQDELKAMWDFYVDEEIGTKGMIKGLKYFHICNKRNKEQKMKVSSEQHFMFTRRVYTPDWYSGHGHCVYMGEDRGDMDKAYFHWKQFLNYFERRAFAKSQELLGYQDYGAQDTQISGDFYSDFAQIPEQIAEPVSNIKIEEKTQSGAISEQPNTSTDFSGISKSKLKNIDITNNYYEIK